MNPENLADPVWRLHNLYSCKDAKTGQMVPFRPSKPQAEVIHRFHVLKQIRLCILKARQLGFSTLIELIFLDLILWRAGIIVQLVDMSADDAHKKLSEKVKDAVEALPAPLRQAVAVEKSNEGEFRVRVGGDPSSAFYAGARARGGTTQALHVSEWGPIAAMDPKRSEEILTGALPAAVGNPCIIETTWYGGKVGHLWENIVRPALELPEQMKRSDDWRILFFPWHDEDDYRDDGDPGLWPAALIRYFEELDAKGVKLDQKQRAWYHRNAWPLGVFRYREYPSTLEECFKTPIEGAIYAESVDRARGDGRIAPFPWERGKLVFTFWDLGSPKNTVVWYAQFIGREIHVIDLDHGLEYTTATRVSHMLAKGYNLAAHFLPHDADAEQRNGKTFRTELEEAGLSNVRTVPRTHDIWIGINRLQELFPRMRFQSEKCAHGIDALSAYRQPKSERLGMFGEMPVHDWSSHFADALRTMAEAEAAGMIVGQKPDSAPIKPPTVRAGVGHSQEVSRRITIKR